MISPCHWKSVVRIGLLLLLGLVGISDRTVTAFVVSPTATTLSLQRHFTTTTTTLKVVADPPFMKEEEKKKRDKDENNSKDDWIPSGDGGFIPNIKARLFSRNNNKIKNKDKPSSASASPSVLQVKDIYEYKREVADVKDQMVCVRFYAPWCRSCKAIEAPFRRLSRDYPTVKFVEVPVTEENTYLHKGLGVPSLPFAHLYDPNVGLVEERSLNKKIFGEFQTVLDTYVQGECPVSYSEDGSVNSLQSKKKQTVQE